MRQDVTASGKCRWIDIVGPDREELLALADEFDLPRMAVEDCLDPEHLPKVERFDETTFLILRARDHAAPDDASTIQELTRKVALFFRDGLLITVHRADLMEIGKLRERFAVRKGRDKDPTHIGILLAVVLATLESYESPLERTEETLGAFEEWIFNPDLPAPSIREMHYVKRRIGLTRRIVSQMNTAIGKLAPAADRPDPMYQEMRDAAEAYTFWVDQIADEVTQLIQLHLAMQSNNANEVMRVLTIFSAFFLPLSFIAGVYGMNFVHMPELGYRLGYPAALLLMVGVSVAVYLWCRRRGWL
jgi:magnesium transporter